MNAKQLSTLQYWRASLPDSALGKGKFRQDDLKDNTKLSRASLRAGQLNSDEIENVFRGVDKAIKSTRVRIWPLVASRRFVHGAVRGDGAPDTVAPIITEAMVDRHGTIYPERSTIARDILAPLPEGEFSLGSIDDLDKFLTECPPPQRTDLKSWTDYLNYQEKLVEIVIGGWPKDDPEYDIRDAAIIENSEQASATIRQNLNLYDKLLKEQPETPLLSQLIEPSQSKHVSDGSIESEFKRWLGHSNPHFPLAEHQRQVLAWLDHAEDGEVLAVNGPPGTGKTTMLLSAVASLWVRATLAEAEAPIIVAASSNNQAVTNIIDAFGKDLSAGEGPFAGRWIPDVKSFGMFLPSKSRKATPMSVIRQRTFKQK